MRRSSGTTRIFNISVYGGTQVTNAVIDGFTIREGNYGGVYMTAGTVQNCVIASNVNSGGGYPPGGIDMTTGTVQNCLLIGNSGDKGGGIRMTGGVISNCIFTGNSAVFDGGGIQMGTPGGLVVNCIITNNNTVSRWGGGIMVDNIAGSGGTIRNCLIARNSAVYDGGGICCYSASPRIENCTIVSNSAGATYSGGGVCQTVGGTPTMTNTIVYFNSASAAGTNLSGTIAAGYSCSPDLTNGVNGNLTDDPLFEDIGAGDYHLSKGSPCINAGKNAAWMNSATDLDGNPRINSKTVDMGAYEIQLPPSGTMFMVQ